MTRRATHITEVLETGMGVDEVMTQLFLFSLCHLEDLVHRELLGLLHWVLLHLVLHHLVLLQLARPSHKPLQRQAHQLHSLLSGIID